MHAAPITLPPEALTVDRKALAARIRDAVESAHEIGVQVIVKGAAATIVANDRDLERDPDMTDEESAEALAEEIRATVLAACAPGRPDPDEAITMTVAAPLPKGSAITNPDA